MNSIADDIKILKKIKLLGEDDDIDVFDEAVYRISLNGDNSVIKELCEVLNDSASTPSAMDNVIQCIFTIANRCGLEDGIYEILCNVDKILINAKRCFIQINRMILNYEPFNNAYISAIKRLGDEELSSLIDILYQLKDKYSDKYIEGTVKIKGEVRDISRRVYQTKIDWDYIPKDSLAKGLTNKELALKGKSPYTVDKNGIEAKIELHHLTQVEVGSMVEIVATTHDEYTKILHGLVEIGGSFRNNITLDKQYSNFLKKYWRWRAKNL